MHLCHDCSNCCMLRAVAELLALAYCTAKHASCSTLAETERHSPWRRLGWLLPSTCRKAKQVCCLFLSSIFTKCCRALSFSQLDAERSRHRRVSMFSAAETLPLRCQASLLAPVGGASTSWTAQRYSSSRRHVWGTGTWQPRGASRHAHLQTRAEYERQQDPRWRGPPTQTYDDRDLRRSPYDYPPPPPQDPRYRQQPPPEPPTQNDVGPGGGGPGGPDSLTKALIGGAFVLGIGVGVWFNSEATFHPSNVASTEIIDRKTPNTEVCMANGFSSMVFDQRLFVSFNPYAPVVIFQPCREPAPDPVSLRLCEPALVLE